MTFWEYLGTRCQQLLVGAYQHAGAGNQIFRGISSPVSANTPNEVLSGTLGIVVPALPFDAGYVLIGRLTISRGFRG
uniref:ABC transporter permease n=1 Tax=Streptomyces auratus AGR0001 TaxID=1160718 RepID=J2JU91_9ACTN